jgi:hypothetical protein
MKYLKLNARFYVGETLEGIIPFFRGQTLGSNLASIDFSGVTTFALPAGTTLGGVSLALSALGPISSTSANAFAVGPNATATTNPSFNIDASTGSAITGLNIKSAASGNGVALLALGSANELITLDAAGTGILGINTLGTTSGLVTIGNSTSVAGAAINGPLTITSASASSLAVGRLGATTPAFAVASNTGSQAAGLKVTGAAANGTVAVVSNQASGNNNLTIDAKGTGTVGINTVGTTTGLVTIGNTTSLLGLAVNGPLTFSNAVVTCTASTLAPSAAQSGTVFMLNRAAGITVTLPVPVVGMIYRFIVCTANTGTLSIITDTGTTYLQGAIVGATTTASVFNSALATHNINVSMNGSTTGGLIGTDLTFVALTTGLWNVSGTDFCSGTAATPFATS